MFYDPVLWTDQGNQRKINQDSVLVKMADTDHGQVALAVICDGCGGLSRGELASKQVVKHFDQWFEKRLPGLLYGDCAGGRLQGEMEKVLNDENEALMRYSRTGGFRTGTTATVLLLYRSDYYLVHIGDSRCYHIRGQMVKLMTQDDTVAAVKLEQGLLTQEEARNSRESHILTQCIGVSKDPEFHYSSGQAFDGDSFLLCTDGFWHQIRQEELALVAAASDPQDALVCAVRELRGRQETDNITAVLVRVSGKR